MKYARYSDLSIGQTAQVVRSITDEDIEAFGKLSGDYNPLHFDEDWAKTTLFKGRIAHGLLTASFISTVIGMKLPGTGTIYLSQSMTFLRPVRIGDTITAKVEVVGLDDATERVKLKSICTNQHDKIVLEGESVVTLMRSKS